MSGFVVDSLGEDTEVIYRRGLTEAEWANVTPRFSSGFEAVTTIGAGCVLLGDGAGPRGIQRSCDGGRTWTERTWPDGDHIHVDCLFLRPSDGVALGCHEDAGDLVVSRDDGATWALLGASFPGAASQPRDLAEHPTAGPDGGPRLVAGLQGHGYAFSDDGGLNWTPSTAWNVGQYLPDDLVVDPVDGTAFDGRLYAMTNDGLSPDPRQGEGLLGSDDGATWWLVRHFPTGFGDVTVASDGSVWVGTYESAERRGRVWRSGDGGATWADVTGTYSGLPVTEIAAGPDGRIYVGGGFRQGGAPSPGGGLWRTVDPVYAVAGEPGAPGPPAGDLGLSVHPNPTGGSAHVAVRVAGPERVRLAVVDALGREVAVLHDGPAADGQRVAVETAGWAPGVYRVIAVTARGARASAALTVTR